jgi:hypothetical protein
MNPNVREPRFKYIQIRYNEKDVPSEDVHTKIREKCKKIWGDDIEFTDDYYEGPIMTGYTTQEPYSRCFEVYCCFYRNFVCPVSINIYYTSVYAQMERIMPLIDNLITLREKVKEFKEFMSNFESIEIEQ